MMKTWNYHLNPMKISLRQYFLIVDKIEHYLEKSSYNARFLNTWCGNVQWAISLIILVIFCVWYTILPLIRLSNLDEMLAYKNINKTAFSMQNSSTFLPKDHQLSYQRTNHDLKFDFPIIWIYTNIVKRYLKCF